MRPDSVRYVERSYSNACDAGAANIHVFTTRFMLRGTVSPVVRPSFLRRGEDLSVFENCGPNLSSPANTPDDAVLSNWIPGTSDASGTIWLPVLGAVASWLVSMVQNWRILATSDGLVIVSASPAISRIGEW